MHVCMHVYIYIYVDLWNIWKQWSILWLGDVARHFKHVWCFCELHIEEISGWPTCETGTKAPAGWWWLEHVFPWEFHHYNGLICVPDGLEHVFFPYLGNFIIPNWLVTMICFRRVEATNQHLVFPTLWGPGWLFFWEWESFRGYGFGYDSSCLI